MTAVAPSDEEIVVVVASQQHAVRQRRELGERALGRAPDHAAFAVGEAVGVLARILRGRVPQGKDPDDYLRAQPDGWPNLREHALPVERL